MSMAQTLKMNVRGFDVMQFNSVASFSRPFQGHRLIIIFSILLQSTPLAECFMST